MGLSFEALGLSAVQFGDNVMHIRFGDSTVPVGCFQRNVNTGLWFFSGTGWTQYSAEWLDGISGKLKEMNKETLAAMPGEMTCPL